MLSTYIFLVPTGTNNFHLFLLVFFLVQAAYVYAYIDMIAMIIFLCAYVWLRLFERYEAASVDRLVISVSDYSVQVTGIPEVIVYLMSSAMAVQVGLLDAQRALRKLCLRIAISRRSI